MQIHVGRHGLLQCVTLCKHVYHVQQMYVQLPGNNQSVSRHVKECLAVHTFTMSVAETQPGGQISGMHGSGY